MKKPDTCSIKPNFVKDKDIAVLPANLPEASTIEETLTMLVEHVVNQVNTSYSMNEDESEDPVQLSDAKLDMIHSVIDQLDNYKFANPELTVKKGSDNSKMIEAGLILALDPVSFNKKIDLDVQAVIHPKDSTEELNRRSLDESLSRFFKGYTKNLYKQVMRERLASVTTINLKQRTITTDVVSLNSNIEDFLQQNYLTLIRYMETVGPGVKWGNEKNFPTSMWHNTHNIIKTLDTYLNQFEWYLEFLRRTGELDNLIEEGYNSYVFEDKKNTDFLEAVFSFLTLKYFDPVLRDTVGNQISFNKDLKQPFENGTTKYYYGKDIEGRVQGWGVEARDALKELGNYSKLLISLIKIVDPETKKVIENEEMRPVDYFQTMTQLLRAIPEFIKFANESKNGSEFDKYLAQNLRNNLLHLAEAPVESMRAIMFRMHEAMQSQYYSRNKSKLMEVLEKLFNAHELRILESIYQGVFSTTNPRSMYMVERNFIEQTGISYAYPIVETLVAQIVSSTQKDYGQTIWNKDHYERNIKLKFNTDKMMYELVNSMNIQNTQDLSEHPYKLIAKNNFRGNTPDSNKEVYVFDVDGVKVKIEIPTNDNTLGLFQKTYKDAKVFIEENGVSFPVEDYFKKIKVDTHRERRATINSNSGVNKNLRTLLKFVDTFTGTSFSNAEDGLQRYSLIKRYEKNALSKVILTAFRGFYINNINRDFIDAVDSGKYNGMDLDKYIQNEKLIFAKIWDLDQNKPDWKSVWLNTSRGLNLKTANTGVSWVSNYSRVQQIMSGEIARSNIKNAERNSIPNYGLSYEGSNIWTLMESDAYKSKVSDNQRVYDALATNPFTNQPDLILASTVDEDIELRSGDTKMVKAMTDSELYYHSIVDKFFLLLSPDKNSKDDRMEIQPTTYSDKTAFINYVVNITKDNLVNKSSKEIETLIINSIGGMYRTILNNVINDYAIVFPQIASIEDINEKIIAIENIIKNMTESELVSLFSSHNLKLEVDTHFRQINGGKLAFNELLVQYALDTYTNKGLHARLELEKKTMIRNLLESLTTFSLKGEGNPIQGVYNRFIGNDKTWINGENRLILAKDENFKEITSIQQLERAGTIYMNPLLEKFFMLHTYLGNNLRYILSGNELDHKNKMLSKLNLGDRILSATQEQLSKLSKDSLLAKYPELESKLTENEDGTYTLQEITLSDLMKMNPGLQEALLNRVVATNSKQYDVPIQTLSTYWRSLSFADLDYLMNVVPTLQNSLIKKVKADAIYEVEATSQGAQLKRNVIIPGTMRTYTQGSLKGIPSTFRVAVVDDVAAETFNVNGDVKHNNDAHDGSAWICPITSILENWSLQENEVGTVKKPIWHDYNGALGTAVLVKFAAHTITNNVMRKANGGINMYNVFKKMTNNNRWDGMFTDSILNHDDFSQEVITIGKLTGDNQLMYKGKEGRVYVINEIGYENGTYFTLEAEVDPSNGTVDSNQKVYHYFDENSNHIKSDTLISNPAYHQMGSLFEAYQVFGGLNSGYIGGRQFHYSEASLYATAMLTNLVTVANTALIESEKAQFEQDLDKYYAGKTSGKPTYTVGQDQKHYSQPLKLLMVDYIVNNSAIKNGAGNRNSKDRLYNDEKFDTIVLHNQYYGIQMDSDHEADEAEMTEFSQVISALDAGGRLHGYVKDIYYALGDMAIRESQNEHNIIKEFQDAVGINDKASYINEFKKELGIPLTTNIELLFEKALELREDQVETLFSHEFSQVNKAKILPAFKKAVKQYNQLVANARDQLYTIIGDVLIDNISKRSNQAGLTDAILREIKSKFSLKSSHKLDSELKIPFSDPNVYSSILSNFASLITKKSIRRSYPGIGGVLSPGYDIMMIYDLNGKTYQYDDILQEAIEYYNSTVLDIADAEEDERTQEEKDILERFAELDTIQDDTTWNRALVRIYLEQARDDYNRDKYYYDIEADSAKNGVDLTNSLPDWEYYTETFMPTDRVGIRYTDSDDNEFWEDINLDAIEDYYNFKKDPRAFLQDRLSKRGLTLVTIKGFRKNIDKARNLAPSKVWWTYTDVAGRARTKNIYDTEEVKNAFLNKDNSKVQSILDQIDTGEWNGYKITLFNEPAELIMSNIYQTRFNVDADTSLVDILNNKRHTFKDKPIQQTTGIVDRDFYDFIMLKNNGKHSYISFNRSFENQEGMDDKFYKRLSWGRKQRKPSKSANKNIVSDVYVLDDDRRPMFMIGRDVVRDNIKYDKTKDEFYTQEEGKDRVVIKNTNLTWDGNRVTEYVEFVTQHLYKKSAVVDNNDITKNHQVFNIDTKKFKDAFGEVDNDEKEIQYYDELREILKSIYQSDSYECLTLNDKQYSINNSNMIRKIMSELYTKFTYDSNLSNFLHDVYEQVIKDRMITPTKKDGKWHFEITGKENRLGLIHKKGTDAVLVGSAGYANSMATLTRNYYKGLMKRKQTSFLRSLRYTASRIPAQTLQSFMQMKLVGFTGEKENYTYVSHWQTWLQGSDYKDYFRISLS